MTYVLFTVTSIAFFVLLAFAVEQLASTYTREVEARQAYLNKLDDLSTTSR